MRRRSVTLILSTLLFVTAADRSAEARSFAEGSLIIPMDIDYQDHGMFKAFGLIYQLLLRDIPIYWVIDSDKSYSFCLPFGPECVSNRDACDCDAPEEDAPEDGYFYFDPDFTVSAVDVASEAVIDEHGYRAGPFVIDAADTEEAMPIIEAWQEAYVTTVDDVSFPTVTVHEATAAFDGEVARTLTVAPSIAVFADGSQQVAFEYMNAAAIPSCEITPEGELLCQCWPIKDAPCTGWDEGANEDAYATILDIPDVAGESQDVHTDGLLFDDDGLPVWCQLMTMHWKEDERDEGAIAEVHEFLQYPTHFMAECQAVNAVENAENGHFLTQNGFGPRGDEKPFPVSVDLINPTLPFGQFDGPFGTEDGSEPSFSPLYENDDGEWVVGAEGYLDQGIIMLTATGSAPGVHDVWMTGYVDGICEIVAKPVGVEACGLGIGKVSYLGGHSYFKHHDGGVVTPLTEFPRAQGIRLFLNSLFEADCVTTIGQPNLGVELSAPAVTNTPEFRVGIAVENIGFGVAYDVVLTLVLPTDLDFVSASTMPTSQNGQTLMWELGNLGPDTDLSIDLDVQAQATGTFVNLGHLLFLMSLNERGVASNEVMTLYDPDAVITEDMGDGMIGGQDAGSDLGSEGDVIGVEDSGADDGGAEGDAIGADADNGADGSTGQTDGSNGDNDGSIGDNDGSIGGTGDAGSGGSGGSGSNQSAGDEGCSCSAAPGRPIPAALFLLAIVGLVGRRRKRRDRI